MAGKPRTPHLSDTIKENLSEKFIEAVHKEDLSHVVAGDHLGMPGTYLSYVYNKKFVGPCPSAVWYRIKEWVETGKDISQVNFSPIHRNKVKGVPRKKRPRIRLKSKYGAKSHSDVKMVTYDELYEMINEIWIRDLMPILMEKLNQRFDC